MATKSGSVHGADPTFHNQHQMGLKSAQGRNKTLFIYYLNNSSSIILSSNTTKLYFDWSALVASWFVLMPCYRNILLLLLLVICVANMATFSLNPVN